MKTTDYKKGDVLIFEDGKRYEYLGTELIAGILTNVYKPLDGETGCALMKDAAGEFVPFHGYHLYG